MGAMGRDGTMEPWGHEPLGRAEAAEKADVRRGRSHGAPWGGKGGEPENHMECHGAGRADGAEREGRRGRNGKGGGGGEGAEGGQALGPLKVS